MAKPPSKALVNKALHGELTRANTKSGTAARRAVYRSEYVKREQREQHFNVSYPQARRLREAFPLSAPSRAELKRNHKNVTVEHTRYAIIRAQVVRAQLAHGKKISKKKVKGARAAEHLPSIDHPTAALAAWYRNAWGSDYDPRAFAGVAGGPEGPPSKGVRTAREDRLEELTGGYEGGAEEVYGRELIDYAEGEGEELTESEIRRSMLEGLYGELTPEDVGEDYYGDFDTDEWDVWEFGEY